MAKKNVVLKELSKVGAFVKSDTKDVADSVKYNNENNDTNMRILFMAQHCYDDMETLRKNYQRCKNFTYGDQWCDMMTWYDRKNRRQSGTEAQYLMEQGIMPITNNLIRRTLHNIVGVYRNQDKEETCSARDRKEQQYGEVLSTLLQYNNQENNMRTKKARSLEIALMGGFSCFKSTSGWRDHKFDCWTDQISIYKFFCDNNARDYDGNDFRMVGELHNISFDELCASFAKSDKDVAYLKEEYSPTNRRAYESFINNTYRRFGEKEENRNISFYMPEDPNLCRVIEVWTKETRYRYHCWDKAKGEVFDIDTKDYDLIVTAENAARIDEGVAAGMDPNNIALIECDKNADFFVDEYWYYRYLTPRGHTLAEGETPYAHGGHPYTVFLYPFIDGEIHSFVHDIIPQQKLVNRSRTMNEWIDKCSAKGVLMFAKGAFDDKDMEEVNRQWVSPNGTLEYNYKPGVPEPKQISSRVDNTGRNEQMMIDIKMFEDESGVNGAMQGKPGYSTTSGTLYAQQVQNGNNSLMDILESHASFEIKCAYKTLKNILQFYDDNRILQIVGERGLQVKGNADHIRNIAFDISIVQSTTSPTYRAISNNYLIQFWQQGQITMEQLLTHGDFPFADALLQDMKAQQQAQAEAQQAQMMAQQQGQMMQGQGQ